MRPVTSRVPPGAPEELCGLMPGIEVTNYSLNSAYAHQMMGACP